MSRDLHAPPLRPAVFHILLALAEKDHHGLGISDAVERATDGALELGPGTLYRSLKEMTAGGLISEVASPEGADPRRRYYRATARGVEAVRSEAGRLARLVELARERDVLREPA